MAQTAPSWKDDAEVVFTKHLMLRSGTDYDLLDKIMTQRDSDDAKAPDGIFAPSAGAFSFTDSRVGDPLMVDGKDENPIHNDSYSIHDGSSEGATRTDSRTGSDLGSNPSSESFDPANFTAWNWSARPNVTNPSYKDAVKQGDGSWLVTVYWRYADDYLREYQSTRLTRQQSCSDGFLIGVANYKIKYEMVTGGSLEQVTKLEDYWNRNGYAHLIRNGVWNEDKYSTHRDGIIPNSTVYPSGHPLAS